MPIQTACEAIEKRKLVAAVKKPAYDPAPSASTEEREGGMGRTGDVEEGEEEAPESDEEEESDSVPARGGNEGLVSSAWRNCFYNPQQQRKNASHAGKSVATKPRTYRIEWLG